MTFPTFTHCSSHAKELLTHELKVLETPNTETLYSIAVIDLDKTGAVVVVHPEYGDRYFRTSVWDIYGETRTISQKQDGSKPPPYLIAHRSSWKRLLLLLQVLRCARAFTREDLAAK